MVFLFRRRDFLCVCGSGLFMAGSLFGHCKHCAMLRIAMRSKLVLRSPLGALSFLITTIYHKTIRQQKIDFEAYYN